MTMPIDQNSYSPGDLAELLDTSVAAWVSEALASDTPRAKELLEACVPAALVAVLLGQRQQLLDEVFAPDRPRRLPPTWGS
ncbi:hypothetical protein ACW9HF_14980 [Nocardia gipuzkoensis]